MERAASQTAIWNMECGHHELQHGTWNAAVSKRDIEHEKRGTGAATNCNMEHEERATKAATVGDPSDCSPSACECRPRLRPRSPPPLPPRWPPPSPRPATARVMTAAHRSHPCNRSCSTRGHCHQSYPCHKPIRIQYLPPGIVQPIKLQYMYSAANQSGVPVQCSQSEWSTCTVQPIRVEYLYSAANQTAVPVQ